MWIATLVEQREGRFADWWYGRASEQDIIIIIDADRSIEAPDLPGGAR